MSVAMQVHTPSDRRFRVVVTKNLPGDRWLQVLLKAGCQVEICKHSDTILSQDIIKTLISADKTHAVLGQLTEVHKQSGAIPHNYTLCSVDDELALQSQMSQYLLTAAMGWHFV